MNKKLAVLPLTALLLSMSASVNAGICCDPPPPRCDILFDTNKDNVRASEQGKVAALAKDLVTYPLKRIQLQGHADERSTPEYNFDLALRRTWEVKKALTNLGAGENQIGLHSYGEDEPLASGSSEPAWQKNRCVNVN